mgnify:FL=1
MHEESKFTLSFSLCWECANAVPQLCRWIDEGDLSSGVIEYSTRKARGGRKVKPMELYYVLNCRNYRRGSLPKLPPKIAVAEMRLLI